MKKHQQEKQALNCLFINKPQMLAFMNMEMNTEKDMNMEMNTEKNMNMEMNTEKDMNMEMNMEKDTNIEMNMKCELYVNYRCSKSCICDSFLLI
jgi:hypothetical protein